MNETPILKVINHIGAGTHSPAEHGTKSTLTLLPADTEPTWWSLPQNCLLTIKKQSTTRKQLSLYPEDDRSGQTSLIIAEPSHHCRDIIVDEQSQHCR